MLLAGVFTLAAGDFADGIVILYSGKTGASGKAAEIFARNAASDLKSQAFDLLLRRRKLSADKAGDLDLALQAVIRDLIVQITVQNDAQYAFVLSELLDDANSPCRDRELAFYLLKYSVEHNYPAAWLKLGSYLAQNHSNDRDLMLAEQLLKKASEKFPGSANWQLCKLYKYLKQTAPADEALQKAVKYSCAEAVAENAYQEKRLTAENAHLSGRGRFLYAINTYLKNEEKIEELFAAANDNCVEAALAMAVFYNSLVYNDNFMAFNAVYLANTMSSSDYRAQQLIRELDNSGQMAMAMLVMWQNQLKNVHDLRRAQLDDNKLAYDLFLQPADPQNRQRLLTALQQDTMAFYLSGLVFQLKKYKMTYPEIKKLLQSTPQQSDMLPITVAQLLIAAENSDSTWQLELSGKLLKLLVQKYQHFQLPRHRIQLAPVIPGAAKMERGNALDLPETVFALSWNLAINMRVNALLAVGKSSEAGKFLQKYQRFQLPAELKNMERNMVRKFAPELTKKTTSAVRK